METKKYSIELSELELLSVINALYNSARYSFSNGWEASANYDLELVSLFRASYE